MFIIRVLFAVFCFVVAAALFSLLAWNVFVVWTYPAFQQINLLGDESRLMRLYWAGFFIGGVAFALGGAAALSEPRKEK